MALFGKDKKKALRWKCRTCGDQEGRFIGPDIDDPTICNFCFASIKREKERRIKLARSIVGQVLTKTGHPFRESNFDYIQTWKVALDLANNDPFREQRWDKEIAWD